MPLLSRLRALSVDWVAFSTAIVLCVLGLLTMASFTPDDVFAGRQTLWLGIAIVVFFTASLVDWRFLRRSGVAMGIYIVCLAPLVFLVLLGTATQGARSWFDLGAFALQPVEFVKIALIIVLAKYFSRRHTEIRNIRHILISGAYTLIVFVLVAAQPDFGSAIIVFAIW